MKTAEIITDFDNLYRAFLRSKNNRSYKVSAMYFQLDAVNELKKLRKKLADKTYHVAGYTQFEVLYPKRRIVKACKFRDKIVQHVLCDNILVRYLPYICIPDSYAGQKRKGTGLGKRRIMEQLQQFSAAYGSNGYFYRGDVSKFYYNIRHDAAIDIMEYHLPKDTHWLIEEFINSTEGDVGIALGNQINTIVSNLYLDGLDKFIKYELGIEYYGRYADDFYLIHPSRDYVKYCAYCIEQFLASFGLALNPKSQLIPVKTGISFLGFHFAIRQDKLDIRLDNSKKRSYRRKFNKLYRMVLNRERPLSKLEQSYASYKAHAKIVTDPSVLHYYEKKMKEIRRMKKREH